MYYNSQISSLYKEAEPLLTANPDISMELETGMDELDSLSAQIRDDLSDNIANGEVIEALIRNYRLRIELLEDMLALMREKETENVNIKDHEL
jgi:CHASE3 domain sensor protein